MTAPKSKAPTQSQCLVRYRRSFGSAQSLPAESEPRNYGHPSPEFTDSANAPDEGFLRATSHQTEKGR
jgi:hypothetical protein